MKFADMPYERPDVAALKKQMQELVGRFEQATDYGTAKEVFLEWDKLGRHVHTLETLASIRYSINTKDEFYSSEHDFWNMAGPELAEYDDKWTKALLETAFRKELAADFGEILFTNAEIEKKAFSPAIIADMQKENEIVNEYVKLTAAAEIPFEGKTYNTSQIEVYKTDADDARRLAAWKAEGQWYKDNQSKIDDIYDRLVKVRTEMGRKLGYDNYLGLGYCRMMRNCYTKNDIEVFREAVVKYLVPICESIYKEQAKRLGKEYPMNFADNALMFRSGNPRPKGTPDDIVAAGKKFYEALSPETAEFFNLMIDNELLDLLSKEGKRGGGYMTELPDYEVPFIFANFNGSQHDVEVVTHEAGHAFAGYLNRKRIPSSEMLPTMEACEVHSMSMEFFADPYATDFFGDDARKYKYAHLAGSVTFIPYGALVDHFQHICYENPDLTPAGRHAQWKRLQQIYMPWVRLDGEIPFYSDGESWQYKHHIFDHPLYYIDYCLAQTVALSFWAMIQEDAGEAWKHYMTYSKLGGSLTFTELLKEAGLETPFGDAMLRKVCAKAEEYLDAYDLGGIS